ncbi:hypothetical protein BAMA_02450 [Bacillus manliponensis]|uniref:Uncharacterized protein n=1 Tax=Bacillus manliponensis TaxID=574376 RepID=A0A073JXH0_9BACI|nr:hypothetical protein BAMA_02450 [Bacillus manliponensis]
MVEGKGPDRYKTWPAPPFTQKRALLNLFLFLKKKNITYTFLFNTPESVVISTFLHLFSKLGESKVEKHHEKMIKLLLQNGNKQSILTFVNLRAEVVVTT